MNNFIAVLPYVLFVLSLIFCVNANYQSAFLLFVIAIFIVLCYMAYTRFVLCKNHIKHSLKDILQIIFLDFPNKLHKDSIKTLQKEQMCIINPFQKTICKAYNYDNKDIFPRVFTTSQYHYLYFNIIVNEMAVLKKIGQYFEISHSDMFECEKFISLARKFEYDLNVRRELLEVFGKDITKIFIKDDKAVCLEISKKMWRQNYCGIYFHIKCNDNALLYDIKQLDIIPSYPWYEFDSCVPSQFFGKNASFCWSYGDFEEFLKKYGFHKKEILKTLNAPLEWQSLIIDDIKFQKFLSKVRNDDYGFLG